MNSPELDVEARTPIWDCMQDLYMDTDVTLSYEHIARVCAGSKYSLAELECILFNEVLPALRINMSFILTVPEWAGFKTEWLVNRILEHHRYGKRKPWRLRKYTLDHWTVVLPLIEDIRNENNDKVR